MKSTYGRLCEATADELFDSDRAGLPVYTLPEDEAIARIVESVGLDPIGCGSEFCRVVGSTLLFGCAGHPPLHWHTEATKRHLSSRPRLRRLRPCHSLVVFTLAAESMHADTAMAANNFYGRVRPLLGVPTGRGALVHSALIESMEICSGDLSMSGLKLGRESAEYRPRTRSAICGTSVSRCLRRWCVSMTAWASSRFEEEGLPPGFRDDPRGHGVGARCIRDDPAQPVE